MSGVLKAALVVVGAAVLGGLATYACACLVMRPRRATKHPEQHPLVVRNREEP